MSFRIKALLILFFSFDYSFSQNSDFLIQEFHQVISASETGKKEESTFLFRINNKLDNWLGEIEIYHSPDMKYKLNEAVILDRNMTVIRKVKPKEIHTEHAGSDVSFFDDGLIDVFTLIHNEYPYYIRYSYTTEVDEFLFIDNWRPILDTRTGTALATLTVKHPESYLIKTDTSGRFEYENTLVDQTVIEKWTKRNAYPPVKEANSPPFEELADFVKIVPLKFKYGPAGSHENWETYGKWKHQLTIGKDQLSSTTAESIREKFKSYADTIELIKNLYYFLQDHTRYISVDIGIGGMEPYSAEYVTTNKFGDCKALTMYMKALLNVFNIPSFYTTVYAGENPVQINPDFPAQQFNHVFLIVPLKNDTLWLENTSNSMPFNYVGTFTQNRKVLISQSENSHLITTPALKDNITKSLIQLNFENESLAGTIEVNVHHAPYEDFSYIIKNFTTTDRQKYFQKYLDKISLQLSTYDAQITHRDFPDAKLTGEVTAHALVRKIGNQTILKLPGNRLPNTADFKNRKNPIRFNYPETFQDDIRITTTIPKIHLSEPIQITSKFGEYSCTFSRNGNEIIIERSYTIFSGDYPTTAGSELITWLKAIDKFENNNPIIFN